MLWRITYPPRYHPGAVLVEDVEADEIEQRDGSLVLIVWRCVIFEPRRIVVRRLPSGVVVVERLCSRQG
jgi:hypothetical protein